MSGNVLELCSDAYYYHYSEGINGERTPYINPETNQPYRVARGGSWNYETFYHRNTLRYRYPHDDRGFIIGFRLAHDVE